MNIEKNYCSNCKNKNDDIELELCSECQDKYFEDLKKEEEE